MKNNRNVILFDLDSTLLQVNQDLLLHEYFKLVDNYSKTLNFDNKDFINIFIKSAYNIVKNDGTETNYSRFWKQIDLIYGNDTRNYLEDSFALFYEKEFPKLEKLINKSMIPSTLVKELKQKGYKLFLATNPLYPRAATLERMRWAGLKEEDFIDITTYENCTFCKPRKEYFIELLNKHNINEEECIMVGNDLDDDFIDLPNGISKILITDYIINTNNKPIDMPHFKLSEFLDYTRKNF